MVEAGECKGKGKDVEGPASGEEEVVVRKDVRAFHVKTHLFGVVFLLVVPAFPIRGVPHQQDVPGSRPKPEGWHSAGNGNHRHWGSGPRPRRRT